MPSSTHPYLIALLDRVADEIDRDYPTVRQTDMARWANLVALRGSIQDPRIGRKRADAGRPLSNDTFGVLFSSPPPREGQHAMPFFAVSVARDNPEGGNERRKPPLDYGLVEDQLWVFSGSIPPPPLSPPPSPMPPPSPLDLGPVLAALTSITEDMRAMRAGQDTLIARVTAIESASGRQTAMLTQAAEHAELFARRTVTVLESVQTAIESLVAALPTPQPKPPRYRGKLFGITIILVPEP